MKKHFTLLFALSATIGSVLAQATIVPQSPPDMVYGSTSDTYIEASFGVKNTSATPKAVRVERHEIFIIPNTINYMCWGIQCYGATTSVTPDSIIINPGETNYSFKGDYESNGNPGTSIIRYCFYDIDNPSDSSCVEVKFQVGTVGITERSSDLTFDIYPNPASDKVTLTHNLTTGSGAHVVVRDMLGKVVRDVPVNTSGNEIPLDISDLQPGIYFYSVITNGEAMPSKRLVVR